MKVGMRNLDDAVMNLSIYKKINNKYGDKEFVLKAINKHDYKTLREISNYFYESSGIYERLCKYLAYLYKYDWFVTPFVTSNKDEAKVLTDFSKVLNYLDRSNIKKIFGDIALEVVKNGAYYGYLLDLGDNFTLQQLPNDYCRSRFSQGNNPAIELNLAFFDSQFTDIKYRIKVLKMFPQEIQKAYVLYKEGKLVGDTNGDKGWYLLDPSMTVKFNLGNSDCPTLVGAIPSVIDLDAAQELDRKKTMQQLLKIVIQKLPLDKNGDLIFDVDESRDIHNNAVAMLKRAVGVDVLTTFADIDVADMQDKNTTTSKDDLQKVERTAFNNFGISQNLFNTDGQTALEKSIANDEAVMRDLKLQFASFLTRVVEKFNRKNHYNFNVDILETTIYNYKEISKMYKEQTQIGFSWLLPQVALGHSQSTIIATANFENNVLKLSEIMIPPMMSSTMSSKNQQKSNGNGEVGRPEKEDDQKSEKTIKNKEAMS